MLAQRRFVIFVHGNRIVIVLIVSEMVNPLSYTVTDSSDERRLSNEISKQVCCVASSEWTYKKLKGVVSTEKWENKELAFRANVLHQSEMWGFSLEKSVLCSHIFWQSTTIKLFLRRFRASTGWYWEYELSNTYEMMGYCWCKIYINDTETCRFGGTYVVTYYYESVLVPIVFLCHLIPHSSKVRKRRWYPGYSCDFRCAGRKADQEAREHAHYKVTCTFSFSQRGRIYFEQNVNIWVLSVLYCLGESRNWEFS